LIYFLYLLELELELELDWSNDRFRNW